MTLPEFFGCAFLAFGPALAMFTMTIAQDPIRIIILVAAAFLWLCSLLLSSFVWFIFVPLRDVTVFGMIISILIQVIFNRKPWWIFILTAKSCKIIPHKRVVCIKYWFLFPFRRRRFDTASIVCYARRKMVCNWCPITHASLRISTYWRMCLVWDLALWAERLR